MWDLFAGRRCRRLYTHITLCVLSALCLCLLYWCGSGTLCLVCSRVAGREGWEEVVLTQDCRGKSEFFQYDICSECECSHVGDKKVEVAELGLLS